MYSLIDRGNGDDISELPSKMYVGICSVMLNQKVKFVLAEHGTIIINLAKNIYLNQRGYWLSQDYRATSIIIFMRPDAS